MSLLLLFAPTASGGGPQTVSLTEAVAAGAAATPTVVLGGLTVPVGAATGTAGAQDATATLGALLATPASAIASGVAQDVGGTLGGLTVSLSASVATGVAQDVAAGVGVTVAVSVAVSVAAPQPVVIRRAFTTAADGNWSNTATWTGGVVPGDGDTVIYNHNLTVDVAVTVGHSPGNADATKALACGTVNKVLTVAAPLTVRGDMSLKGNTTKTTVLLVEGSGAGIEFDSSAAASPSTTKYQLLVQDANNGYTVCHFNGTVSNPVYLRSNAGGGNAYLTRGGFTVGGWLKASYCDITRIGDSSNNCFDFYLGNNSGAEIILQNSIFDACGLLTSSTAVVSGGEITIQNCTWKNTAHATKALVLPTFTNSGTKVLDDNVFDKEVDIGQGAWVVTDNLFLDKYVATAGTKWDASSGGNMVCNTATGALNVYADLNDEFWYKRGAQANPQHCTLGVTSSLTVDGCIFACENGSAVGDAIQPGAPSSARVYTVKNTILLPDEDQVVQPGKLFGLASVNANVTAVSEHNTYISTAAGETGNSYGETYSGYDGIFSSIKSNLAWSPTSGGASIAIRQAGTVQQSDASKWDYNATWNGRTGSDGLGYNSISTGTIFSSGSPGVNDVTVTSDPFFDSTRNLPTWDAALGGDGTPDNALAELAKRNDRTGYDSAYTIAALVAWVKDGFRVIDASLLNAGHDGVTIGAMPYYATPTTVGLSAALAAGVAQDVVVGTTVAVSSSVSTVIAQDVGVVLGGGIAAVAAALAAGVALDTTITLGGLTVSATTAVAAGAAQAVAVTLGGLLVPLAAALASGVALDPTIALGGVTVAATEAIAAGSAQAVAVTLGGLVVPLAAALASGVALDPTITAGLSASVTEAIATGSAQPVAVTLGGLAVPLASALATGTALDVAATIGLTVPLAESVAVGAAQAVGILLGGVTAAPSAAQAAVSALGVTCTLGALLVALSEATGASVALTPTVTLGGLTAALGAASGVATAEDVLAGGALGTQPTAAVALAVALAPSITLGATSAALVEAIAAASGQPVGATLGGLLVPLAAALATGTALAPTIALGGLTAAPSSAVANAIAVNASATVGGLLVSLPSALAAGVALAPSGTFGGIVVPATAAQAAAVAQGVAWSGALGVSVGAATATATGATVQTVLTLLATLDPAVATVVAVGPVVLLTVFAAAIPRPTWALLSALGVVTQAPLAPLPVTTVAPRSALGTGTQAPRSGWVVIRLDLTHTAPPFTRQP